jgi:hypothetical protein
MSLHRLIYYSAVISGWTAFLGWFVSEFLLVRAVSAGGSIEVAMVGAVVGASIGAGLSVVGGMSNAQWQQQLKRALPGLLGGGLGGAIGGLTGNLLFTIGLPRALGWLIMGLGIGAVDGLYERSQSKIRNGLIGGGIGGLVGGFLFDPIVSMIASGSGMSSRATAFVILGICIGALIGLVQVVLKEAWLTVLDGYRSGRQLILSHAVTVLGRSDRHPLPFLGASNKDVELDHLRILKRSDSRYVLEDNNSKMGTRVNGTRVTGQVVLKDGDLIQFGPNSVRFSERQKRSQA